MEAPETTLVTADGAPRRPGTSRSDRLLRAASGVALLGLVVLAVLGVRAELRRDTSWDPAVAALAKEVELQRGSRFLRPVRIEQASAERIREVLGARARRDALVSALPEGTPAVLGLAPGSDPAAGARTVSVVYDEASDRLLVASSVETSTVEGEPRRVLAAELTRALLQQVAPADEPPEGVAAFVRSVLVAGEVHRVANRLAGDVGRGTPNEAGGIDRLGGALGEPLVLSLATQGGLDLVDAHLRRPPGDTAFLLDPFAAKATQGPAADDGARERATLGPLPWFLALTTATDAVVALRAVGGTFTDDVVVEQHDGRPCLSAVVTTEPDATPTLQAALGAWAAVAPQDRRIELATAGPGSMTVEACARPEEPTGPAPGPETNRLDTAVAVAAAASFATLSGVVDHGIAPATARCAAFAAIDGLPPAQLDDRVLIARRTIASATSCR